MSTAPSIIIRRPTVEDAEDLAAVHIQCWRETYSMLVPSSFYDERALARRRQMWRNILAGDGGADQIRLAEIGGRIIGFAVAGKADEEHPARQRQLYSLYVERAYHGCGVGQALLEAVVDREHAQLWVARDNPRARRCYQRNGFVPDGAEKIDGDLHDLPEVRLVR